MNLSTLQKIMKNKLTEEQINEAADKLLKDLENMSDGELLKSLEECKPGPFSQMIEDGFTLSGMEEINNNSFDPNEHYERTKEKRFKDSCKLDGIDVEVIDSNTTLEEVIQKHKK